MNINDLGQGQWTFFNRIHYRAFLFTFQSFDAHHNSGLQNRLTLGEIRCMRGGEAKAIETIKKTKATLCLKDSGVHDHICKCTNLLSFLICKFLLKDTE